MASAPEPVRGRGLKQIVRAVYQGPRKLTVTFYEMGAGAVAFELMQQWRPQPGRQAFYQKQWFVVLECPGADYPTLSAVTSELEQALAGS